MLLQALLFAAQALHLRAKLGQQLFQRLAAQLQILLLSPQRRLLFLQRRIVLLARFQRGAGLDDLLPPLLHVAAAGLPLGRLLLHPPQSRFGSGHLIPQLLQLRPLFLRLRLQPRLLGL